MSKPSFLSALKKEYNYIKPLSECDVLPKFYISTGNYAVNKIIAGSMFRGIPNNKITTFYGESGCVPFTAKIYVLAKTDVEISEVLEYVKDDSIFENLFDEVSNEDKVNMLREIGYNLGDICRRVGITRQALWLARKNTNNIDRKNKNSNSSVYKLNTLLRKNIYMMPMHGIKLLNYKNAKFLVLTPAGFRRCSKFIDKGEKETYVMAVSDCPTTTVSKDHLVQMEDGKFEFAENLFHQYQTGFVDRKIKTVFGDRNLLSIRDGGMERMCDIEIQDDCHSYFANDIAGHNSGKSLIVSEIIINAIKTNKFDCVFYLDSEDGMLNDKFASALTEEELDKVERIPVENIEDCAIKIHKIYKGIREEFDNAKGDESKEPKYLVVLDSFSGLSPSGYTEKALQDKVAADMGASAKAKNAMIKSLMMPVSITGCPLVIICHAYANMNAMGPQKFKELSGGEGIKYASHIVIQSTKSKKRQEDAELGLKGGGSYYAGNAIRYITYKDRLVKEGLETTMYVDLNNGISKYAGLWDDAVRLGFIKQLGAWYQVPSWKEPDKKFRKDDIAENDEIWNTFLDKMDEIFKVETKYGNKEFAPTSSHETKLSDEDLNELESK